MKTLGNNIYRSIIVSNLIGKTGDTRHQYVQSDCQQTSKNVLGVNGLCE